MSSLTHCPTPDSGCEPEAFELPLDAALRMRRAPVHRIVPSLFDRLCADAPPSARTVQAQHEALRALVLRDLQQLLCTVNHERRLRAEGHAGVLGSCWNYGVAPFAGELPGERRWTVIEHQIRDAMVRYR